MAKCDNCGKESPAIEWEIIESPTESPFKFDLKIKCPKCGYIK